MASDTGPVVVNGVEHEVDATDTRSLLEWLRDHLGLTGTKYGCGESACGACSVLLDGELARACVVGMAEVAGRTVTTVEGLTGPGGSLHPVQQAFVDAGAMQCGYCTPGMVVATVALLAGHPRPTADETVRWMAPNVCRCCAYPRIVDAIERAAGAPARVTAPAPEPLDSPAFGRRPRKPWDLTAPDERDYFDVLGDGLVVVAPVAPAAPGMWSPTGGAWLHIDASGAVTAFTGKVEVGQGTRHALQMVVAEELGADPAAVRLVMGDTDVCPFDAGTFGSLSMPAAMPELRLAAAAARGLLRESAVTPGTRRVELVNVDHPQPTSGPREAAPSTRWGDAAAATGAKRFASDMRRPGMLHGALLRPPQLGATLRLVDTSGARKHPGVTVVVDGDFVGVVAPTASAARAAIAAIDAEWEPTGTVAQADLEDHLRTHPATVEGWGGAFAHDAGDVDAALAVAAHRLRRTYTAPYIAHAPLETRVALAEWEHDRLTIWTGTQQPFGTRRAVAAAFGIPEPDVRVIVPDTGAGFGGKHEPDVALAAARLARAAGAPVRVHWTRAEEFTWAYFRPAAVIDIQGGATSDGGITAWEFVDINAGSAAITAPYDFPNQRLRFEPAESPLRQGPYRALAATVNTFARESFVDELAHELRVDPLELRLRHLADARLATVLRTAAAHFGWDTQVHDVGYGAGIAAGLEKGGRSATCVLAGVDGDRLEVVRVVTAFECGAVVDPENLRNQIEGATIMGLGGALFEAVQFDAGRITNAGFSQYRVPRFTDVPPIEVVLVDRPDLPSAGGGETPITTIAPAIANAIFAACGRRIRALPLTDDHGLRASQRDG
ncbi:MAG TPA: molybdopterin cofactor-binding domain-containing protein [Acidimicrobiia bacterium]|nr:molybdopterin cofactor-binding domain-containing protein [Acidimicrobiia bacterium]